MTIVDCARTAQNDGVQLIRYRKDSHKQTGTAEYDCKPMFTGGMVIELMSLYLPLGTVNGLAARAVTSRNGGGS